MSYMYLLIGCVPVSGLEDIKVDAPTARVEDMVKEYFNQANEVASHNCHRLNTIMNWPKSFTINYTGIL